MHRSISLAWFVALVTLAPVAFAKQPAPVPKKGDDAPPAEPKEVAVDDPMLASVPPPPHVLKSWSEALKLIAAKDVDLNTAIAEVERARGARRQVLGQALPTITATGTLTLQIIRANGQITTDAVTGATTVGKVPPSPQEDANITIVQPILAPRVWYAIGTADKNISLAEMSVEDTRRKLVSTVADAIVGVVSAEEVAEINRSALKATLRRLELTKKGVELGTGAKVDLVRFEQDVTSARQTLVDGDEQLLQARETLGIALGANQAYGVAPDIKLDDIETSTSQTCKSGKLRDRADIRALYAKKELSERAVTDADLEYSPTAEVSSTLAASSEPLVANGHASWDVMGVITIPIWDGGVRYGDRRVAKAGVTEAELAIQGGERQAEIGVTQAERAVLVAKSDRELAERARDQYRDIKRFADQAYAGGTGTSFDIVDATDKLRQAELTLASKELGLARAKIGALLATANCKY